MTRPVITHDVATWNVEYGHDVDTHVRAILALFTRHRLDVLMLQEVRDYRVALAQAARRAGFHLIHFGPASPGYVRGMDQQAILVRHQHMVGHTWTFPAGPAFGRFLSMFPVAAYYDGVIYVSTHAPVGAKVRPGRFLGPVTRVRAFVGHTRRLAQVVRRHPKVPVVIGGDWNAQASYTGRGTPQHMAASTGGRVYHSGGGTGHGNIDYFVAARARVAHVRVDHLSARFSDHLAVLGQVRGQRRG